MKRLLALFAASAIAVASLVSGAAAQNKEVVVAEPLHGLGYLPLYVAIRKGYFAEEGIDAKVLTMEGGGAHTNAVLTKQAFAFIGGPEHNAFAKAKGAELRAVVNVVDRGNIYMVARTGVDDPTGDLASYFKGKKIATGLYGGTPNSITRYVIDDLGLDFRADVTVQEMANAGIMAALKTGQADIGVLSEPHLTAGIREGLWKEPFYNAPKVLGPYAYSTLNIRQESIETEPDLVRGFVRAVARGLKFTHDNHEEAVAIAKLEFPTMAEADLKATLERAFADDLWSPDGSISQEAWNTGKAVVMGADILKQDIPYDAIIDMSIFESIKGTI